MKWFVVAVLGLGLVLPMLATDSFAQNQQGKGGQASGSSSGITGTTGNQGGDRGQSTGKGNAGGTR